MTGQSPAPEPYPDDSTDRRAVTRLNREQRRGFKPDRKRLRLRFEDPEYNGLVVLMRSLSVGVFMELAGLSDIDPNAFGPEDLGRMTRLFEVLADGIVEWNLLDDNDQPVPPTVEGLMGEDVSLVLVLANEWMTAVAGVAAPLGRPSTGGRPSEVASLPMEPLSANPPS